MIAEKNCRTCGGSFRPNCNRQIYCIDCGRRGFSTCLRCGDKFKLKGNTTGHYCSVRCAREAQTKPGLERRPCPECGAEFKPKNDLHKFCSRPCSAEAKKRTTEAGRLKTCPACGKEYTSRHREQITCSKACRGVLRRRARSSTCERCGGPMGFYRNPNIRFCSHKCRSTPAGTRRETPLGYIKVKVGKEHPQADQNGWMFEHRIVMARVLDRPLDRHEQVHHKNGKRDDNRPENLELWSGNHGAGARYSDLIDEIMSQPEIAALRPKTRDKVRGALTRVLT